MRTSPSGATRERGLRRRTTSALALALGLSLVLPAAAATAAPFRDVPADSPHLAAIEDLADREVVLGKADGTFGPSDLLTRGQLASILARALDLEPRADGPFTDVSGPHAGAINALASRDIIRGKGDGTFDPNGTITRDQVASMVARFLDLDPVARDAFRDVPSGNVHREAINALAAIEVALGDGAGNYGPRRDLRRDQAASFVSRSLAYADGTPGPGPGPGPVPEPDCPDVTDAPTPGTDAGTAVNGFTPTITVSDTVELAFGETITVTGTGFDPTSNVGTRPPLGPVQGESPRPGQPAGVYVVFGNFADSWEPSVHQSGTGIRAISFTRWALPPAATPAPPFNETQQAQRVDLAPDGSFTTTLDVTAAASEPGGPDGYGVFVYPGSGAVNPNHELEVRTSVTEPASIEDAEVTWGVKESFRNYIVGGIANGSITTSGAVTQAASNGPFTWDATHLPGAWTRTTDGQVTFSGHGGLLHVELSDLRVVTDPDEPETGVLTADVCSRSLESSAYVGYADVHLADLTGGVPSGGTTTYDAVLAPSGVAPFADFYPAGTELDPVTVPASPTG